MRRAVLGVFASVLILTATVQARVMAPAPIPDRMTRADAVVVGKVTAIEEKPTTVAGQEMKVAVIEVKEALTGAKGLTHVRLAFPPAANTRFPQLTPAVGQEACYFLTKTDNGSAYVTQMYFDVVDKKSANFEVDVAVARRCAKLLAEPLAALKAKDAGDRLLAASLLLGRYRPLQGAAANAKQAPIDAEQSKLILLALAEADWTKTDPQLRVSPVTLFHRLGVTAADGWTPPKDFKEFPTAAQKWLKGNADSFRIQGYVKSANKSN